METLYAGYDAFAYFYNKYWTEPLRSHLFPAYATLILSSVPAPCPVLDLCCGTGQFAQILSNRGYEVTGIDSSQVMLHFAQKNAPNAHFILSDACTFRLPPIYSLVTSTYGSLNFVMTIEDMAAVFKNVYIALITGAYFMFDLCMNQRYRIRKGSFGKVSDTDACIIQTRYNEDSQIACSDITLFHLIDKSWQRSDIALYEKCYAEEQIKGALFQAGFDSLKTYDAEKEFHLKDHAGRVIFVACKR